MSKNKEKMFSMWEEYGSKNLDKIIISFAKRLSQRRFWDCPFKEFYFYKIFCHFFEHDIRDMITKYKKETGENVSFEDMSHDMFLELVSDMEKGAYSFPDFIAKA